MKTDRAFCLDVAQLNREWWQKYICWWLPKKGWSESMMTDVHGGYPAVCNAGDARPVHHIAVHLLGQAVLALPEKMQGSMSWYQMQVQRLMFDAWGQRGLITQMSMIEGWVHDTSSRQIGPRTVGPWQLGLGAQLYALKKWTVLGPVCLEPFMDKPSWTSSVGILTGGQWVVDSIDGVLRIKLRFKHECTICRQVSCNSFCDTKSDIETAVVCLVVNCYAGALVCWWWLTWGKMSQVSWMFEYGLDLGSRFQNRFWNRCEPFINCVWTAKYRAKL